MNEAASAQGFWAAVTEVLQERIPSADFYSWFAMAEPVEISTEELTLSFANDFAVRWVNDRFREVLEESVRVVAGMPVHVRLVSRETGMSQVPAHEERAQETDEPARSAPAEPAPAPVAIDVESPGAFTEAELRAEIGIAPQPVEQPGARIQRPRSEYADQLDARVALNPRYRFDTFVIGEGNQLAHAAALSVAEAPGQSYNPLFIYGGTGLGKTHLLHAIGHYAMETRPGTTVAYVTTEGFINLLIQALQRRDKTREHFKEYFRAIDVLLMDDVQFLSGKGASLQEELFHTFNALHGAGGQVVLTSDCEPGGIPQLEDRLRSRFAWGLITDIATPDRETRIAILRKKAKADGLDISNEVLSLIGERINTNVRELEGALTRVVGYASLSGREVTPDLANHVLASYVAAADAKVTIDRIQSVVCEHFSLSHDDLVGARRSADIARPRQIAMYLARVLLGASSTQVGQRFGGRDHSTVLHAERKVETLIKQDREVYDLVEQLTATIRSGSARVQHAQ